MPAASQFKVVVKCPTPNELFQKNEDKLNAAPTSAGEALRDLAFKTFLDNLLKLRISQLSTIPMGSSDVHEELMHSLTHMLNQAQKGDKEASMHLSFEVSSDAGNKKRSVKIVASLTVANITVMGVEPIAGKPGFIRERGQYAQERQARKHTSGKVDHFLTGDFSQTQKGELLAVIDNTKIDGEAGIDIRGSVVKPRQATKYRIQIGDGVVQKVNKLSKIELYAKGHGVVKAKYDNDDNLRHIAVETSIKLGEVGLRSGGHVMSRGKGGKVEALSLDVAEFRSVPIAFEARTQGKIFVKESVQGIVHGASIVADMVNQAPGKFMVATEESITINRTLQSGLLYAPAIVVGNGRVPATIMNCRLHARNRFTGNNITLAGHNELILGNDFFKEPEGKGAHSSSCAVSGQNLFASRKKLTAALQEKQRDYKELNEALTKALLAQVQKQLTAGQGVNAATVRKTLAAVSALDSQLGQCQQDEEDGIRHKISTLLMDIGIQDTMPLLKRFFQKKQLVKEQEQTKSALTAVTQDINAEFTVSGKSKDGSKLSIKCWNDELLFQVQDKQALLTRPAKNEQIFAGPVKTRTVIMNFNYESGLLEAKVTG